MKFRIVPIVHGTAGYQAWKVQKLDRLLGIFDVWTDVVNYNNQTRHFYDISDAEYFINNELISEKLNAEHLAKPIKEYGE